MGRTILELFQGSDFDKAVDSKANEGKGTFFAQIKSFGEQELTGIRVKSAVELNNPRLYGNEATRIVIRSTPELDSMKESKGPKAGDGGLIGKGLGKITKGKVNSLNQLRNTVNGALGIPTTIIPTKYGTTEGVGGKTLKDPKLQIVEYNKRLDEIKSAGAGTFFGNLLSGGTPKTILQQAAGKALTEAKDVLRDTLFNDSGAIKKKFGKKETDKKDESSVEIDGPFGPVKGGTYSEKALEKGLINQDKSKTYNKISDNVIRVGKKYKKQDKMVEGKIAKGEAVDGVEPRPRGEASFPVSEDRFSNASDYIKENNITGNKGFTSKEDKLNQSGIYVEDDAKGGEIKKLDAGEFDFIPLKFKSVVTKETVNFRGTILGLTETVTPSWDSANFSGNPFSFYTYKSIERGISFNFTVYPMSSKELVNNWSKIEFLTSLTYPLGNPDIVSAYQGGNIGAVRAPVIKFTLGDLYKDKLSFIDSLQYTVPDNSTWQLDGKQEDYESSGQYFSGLKVTEAIEPDKGYKLPHMVEVAISLKFIEQRSTTEDRTKLYSFASQTYN